MTFLSGRHKVWHFWVTWIYEPPIVGKRVYRMARTKAKLRWNRGRRWQSVLRDVQGKRGSFPTTNLNHSLSYTWQITCSEDKRKKLRLENQVWCKRTSTSFLKTTSFWLKEKRKKSHLTYLEMLNTLRSPAREPKALYLAEQQSLGPPSGLCLQGKNLERSLRRHCWHHPLGRDLADRNRFRPKDPGQILWL